MTTFSEDEKVIVRLFANGYTYADIAKLLHLNERTIRKRAERMFVKLGARNPQHAVGLAYKIGLVCDHHVIDPDAYANLKLTPNERNVFVLLAKGYSEEYTIRHLKITVEALRVYRSDVCKKLNVSTAEEAIFILKLHKIIRI